MTDTREKARARLEGRQAAGHHDDEQIQALPDLQTKVRAAIDAICERLAEKHIGGMRHPTVAAFHRQDSVAARADLQTELLKQRLARWANEHRPLEVLLLLWDQTYGVLQVTLAYNTLQVVRTAAKDFVDERNAAPEADLMRAVCDAMDLIVNDGHLFRLINMSDAGGLKDKAQQAAATADNIARQFDNLIARDGFGQLSELEQGGLREIQDTARQLSAFYPVGALAAEAVVEFEDWLTNAPVLNETSDSASRVEPVEPPAVVQRAIDEITQIKDGLAPTIREICEPWQQMLVDVGHLMASQSSVFVPKRVSLRYCYPFAVDIDDGTLPWRDEKSGFKARLGAALARINVVTGEETELGSSQFFYREPGHYGGLKIPLQEKITVTNLPLRVQGEDGTGSKPESELQCDVWLEISDMGNHCLCIQPPTLLAPRPHELYRAVRAGTPFVIGQEVWLNQSGPHHPVKWDTMHTFSRDVVVAVAEGLLGCLEDTDTFKAKFKAQFEPGNMQEIVVAQTYPPPDTQPKQIATALDEAVGGKILLRSTHQAASTLAEWVRYPPLSRRDLDLIEDTPVLGMAGDWFANTGEMTVFGYVAAPGWHTDVYTEAGQFASSWSPLLRLWGRRLQGTIQASQPDTTKQTHEPDDDDPYAHVSLRQVERKVRLHLMQIKAEDLCATRAHRQFLDQLLKMAHLERTQNELEAQLQATEHLADWIDANTRETSEKNRNILLAFLTLLGIFGLSGFLAELDHVAGQKFLWFIPMKAQGMWEDNLVFVAFVLAFVVALYFDLLFWELHLPRRLKNLSRRLGRTVGTFCDKVRRAFAKTPRPQDDNPTTGGSTR
jgi:hypothetical protein